MPHPTNTELIRSRLDPQDHSHHAHGKHQRTGDSAHHGQDSCGPELKPTTVQLPVELIRAGHRGGGDGSGTLIAIWAWTDTGATRTAKEWRSRMMGSRVGKFQLPLRRARREDGIRV
eukprot:2401792-Prymnesium_polylepis.1